MTSRRELRLAVLLCLVGSAVVLLAAGQTWATIPPDRFGAVATHVTGDQMSSAAKALGYVGLAAVVALAATKRWGRVVVGILVLLAGVGIAIAVGRVLGQGLTDAAYAHGFTCPGTGTRRCTVFERPVASSVGWAWATLVGGVVMGLSGLLVALRGPRWAALSSSYEAPSARAAEPPVTDKGVWDALDRGEDPT